MCAWTAGALTGAKQASAVQYLKRFYITNSIMTYAPADILKTALFFATKTENHYYRLSKFAVDFGNNTKAEDILASEFLLTQGLRFTFDVRHPFRALEGASMEINAIAEAGIPSLPSGGDTGARLPDLVKRNKAAHGLAREYLKTSALITDVYFHYTPSQIMLAALSLADKELFEWYLNTKFPVNDSAAEEMKARILETIYRCAAMLQTVDPSAAGAPSSPSEKKELAALSKKLKMCRNPEKIDLVGLSKAKREGLADEDEKVVKKRKLERERADKSSDDPFGPSLER